MLESTESLISYTSSAATQGRAARMVKSAASIMMANRFIGSLLWVCRCNTRLLALLLPVPVRFRSTAYDIVNELVVESQVVLGLEQFLDLLQGKMFADARVLQQELVKGHVLLKSLHGRLVHHGEARLLAAGLLGQGQHERLGHDQAAAQAQVAQHVLGLDHQAADDELALLQDGAGQDARLGQDHVLQAQRRIVPEFPHGQFGKAVDAAAELLGHCLDHLAAVGVALLGMVEELI